MQLPKKIIGEIISLKLLNEKDFEQYHQMLSPTIRKILHLPSGTLQETINFLSGRNEKQQKDELLFYTIFDNKDQKLIGSIEIRDPEENPGQLGAWINENYWGDGRYQEALKLATEIYFTWKQVDEVNAHVDKTNLRSIKAHQKFGFLITEELVHDGREVYNMILKRS